MAKFHLPTIEEEVLKRWDEKDVFRRLIQEREKSAVGRFTFFEGPPTANGKPGIHHMLTRSYKDVILRYWTMRGYRIDRKAGWDTHGLPVELEVEKQLGFTKKQDIEDYGIAPFNAKCKESVWKYRELWQKMTRRTAFWVDMEHPYVTYENDYVESLWNIVKKVDTDGRLYQGYRVTPHCPRCVTSLSSHELAQGYKDVEDPSVYIKFRVKGEENKYLLVWTTTPWTLPANVAVATGEGVDYVEAKLAGGETLILARALTSVLNCEYEVVREMKGADLIGLEYEPLYATMPGNEPKAAAAYKVYAADFVSTADGTGLVHIAPAFGPDDAELGKKCGLPTLITVDMVASVTADVPGKGKFFKKADADIMADLTERGLLYKSGVVKHTYPFCWRCDTPLLYIAKASWYIRMSELRDRLLALNDGINWVPDNIKEGRFGEWLREVKDWAVSRERYWGTPLPVWQCETAGCDGHVAVGALAELEEHKPAMNRIFMMRHGESTNNVAKTVDALPETQPMPLTDHGREEVRRAADELKAALGGEAIDVIYCSPLARTRETAELVAAALGLDASKIELRDELREIDFGVMNGRTEAEYHACFNGGVKERFARGTEGGESLTDVRRRTVAFAKSVRYAEGAPKRILVVTHADLLWLAKTGFDGLTDDQTMAMDWYPKNAEWFELDNLHNLPYDLDGRVDVHRPYIDEVQLACPQCGGRLTRVKDVMDCWFDSGSMPYAQWHYPFENKDRLDGAATNYPADFISEAIDQTRGWFYTLLAVAALMGRSEPPYKNVICLGHVQDAKGKKMSKSKGNVVDPFEAVNKLGADAIRHYFFTINQPGEYKRFDEKGVEEVTKKVFMILWNVLSFYKMYATPGSAERFRRAPEPKHVLDEWILSEFAALAAKIGNEFQNYNVIDAGRALNEFVNDLSTWFVRRSRDRFKGSAEERESAVATLGYVLFNLSRVMAPFTPFLADELYREMGGELDSVHLDRWPEAEELPPFNAALREDMAVVRAVVSLGLEQRAKAGIPVRQALASATVRSSRSWAPWALAVVAEELNVHGVAAEEAAAGSPTQVELDTVITPSLRREGAARELVRNLNDWRKQSGLTIQDRIVVTWRGEEFWKLTMQEYGETVAAGTLCDSLVEGASLEGVEPVALAVDDAVIELWPAKV